MKSFIFFEHVLLNEPVNVNYSYVNFEVVYKEK